MRNRDVPHSALDIELGLEWQKRGEGELDASPSFVPCKEKAHLLHLDPEVQHDERGDDTESDGESPDEAEVSHSTDPEEDEGDKGSDDKSKINHGAVDQERER